MSDDPRIEPLLEWNRLARENTEDAIVSSMFEAGLKACEPIEAFSTWLLLGTAAIASFIITNVDKFLPVIKQQGFFICGGFLCASCLFGLLSKIYALLCKIGKETAKAVNQTFCEHLLKYAEEEGRIKESAEFWGINLQTGIRLERVIAEFLAPMPRWIVWQASRQMKKAEGNPQAGYFPIISKLNRQLLYSLLQALSFLGFLISGFVFAAAI